MTEFLEMLKLYSVQVIIFVASLNTVIAAIPDVPWWAVLAVNVCGVIAHNFARRAPQPVVTAKLAKLRAQKL